MAGASAVSLVREDLGGGAGRDGAVEPQIQSRGVGAGGAGEGDAGGGGLEEVHGDLGVLAEQVQRPFVRYGRHVVTLCNL
jgi:hypothetical protein